jgi:eukaryotic-like serine/threonine-protein kinase
MYRGLRCAVVVDNASAIVQPSNAAPGALFAQKNPMPENTNAEDFLFEAALLRSIGPERTAFLDGECHGAPALRARVEMMLEGHLNARNFLEPLPDRAPPESVSRDAVILEPLGSYIGPYKLLQKLGEGGCGIVYLAEQHEPVRRRVALKVIKLGMDTRSVIARFEAERQALALMDHPNIARVFDAGATETGRPYFVMEAVRGIRISEYCDKNNLSTAQRLSLFIQVCHAIQHAHQKGIIHRDIKPSNILITLHDGVPVPKVIDFGIAKATCDQLLTTKTIFTAFEQFVGTPAYMSPEQAEMSGLDIDTRSDIYSLGVLLYELLTGSPPFDAKDLLASGLDAMRKTIREKEAVRPSTKLATLQSAELATTAQCRAAEPSKLLHQLKGDLDWIVMKCLEKDRTRRYETANGLAADLNRHLSNEPVLARPPSTTYRMHKAFRRNKTAFTAATAVAAALVIGLGAATVMFLRERAARKDQQQQRIAAQGEQVRANAQARKASDSEQQVRRSLYAADINLATQAWYLGNLKAARDLLAKHGPKSVSRDLIGMEWRLLWTLCHKTDEAFEFGTNAAPVRSVAPSPDARLVACAIDNGTARILNVHDRKELVLPKQALGIVNSVAFSPDGELLATGGSDRCVHVLDTKDWHEIEMLGPLENDISHISFSPDGSVLAAGSGGTIILWDLASKVRRIFHDEPYVERFAFSPDGRTLAAFGGLSTLVRFWDVISGERLESLEAHTAIILGIAFSPDGHFFASSGHDNRVKLWSRDEGKAPWKHRATFLHEALVRALSFSPGSRLLATGGGDNMVKIWDLNSEECIRTLRGHSGAVTSISFIADGALVSGSKDTSCRLWDAPSGPERNRLAQTGIIVNMSLSADGKTLLTADPNYSRLHLWDIPSQTRIHSFTGNSGFAASSAISPDGKFVAIHRKDDVFQLWTRADFQEPLLTLQGQEVFVGHNVAFSPDSQTLVFPSSRHKVTLWDVTANQRLGELDLPLPGVFGLAFSPGGDRIAIVAGGQVTVWDVKTRTIVQKIGPVGQEIRSIAFSPDGKLLALPTEETVIGIWDWERNHKLATLEGHTAFVDTVAFSPDGKTLASGSYDGTVKLWSLELQQSVATLRGHLGPVTALLFSADGSAFYSASGDATVKIWPIASFAEISTKSQ